MATGKPLKYEPLRAYLAAQPGDTVTVTVTLAEIESRRSWGRRCRRRCG